MAVDNYDIRELGELNIDKFKEFYKYLNSIIDEKMERYRGFMGKYSFYEHEKRYKIKKAFIRDFVHLINFPDLIVYNIGDKRCCSEFQKLIILESYDICCKCVKYLDEIGYDIKIKDWHKPDFEELTIIDQENDTHNLLLPNIYGLMTFVILQLGSVENIRTDRYKKDKYII